MLLAPQKGHTLVRQNAETKYNKVQTEVDLICSSSKYHDPEDEKNAEPDLSNDRRVGLDLVQ